MLLLLYVGRKKIPWGETAFARGKRKREREREKERKKERKKERERERRSSSIFEPLYEKKEGGEDKWDSLAKEKSGKEKKDRRIRDRKMLREKGKERKERL